jgi:hypothetical protein
MNGLLQAALSPAEEGRRVIIGMLITGLVFAAIVIVGEYVHYVRHFRRRHY